MLASRNAASANAAVRDNSIVPLFLLKTYSILNSAPSEIIGWSQAGDSFIVKDIKRMSEEIIPAHFKHSKFSSFVRQLNFYGFRKVKGKLNGLVKSEENAWEFRHPYFLRDKPHLLAEIKRSSGSSDDMDGQQGSQEVQDLKEQVFTLNEKIDELSRTVQVLQNIVLSNSSSRAYVPSKFEEPIQEPVPHVNFNFDAGLEDWSTPMDDDLMRGFLDESDAESMGMYTTRKRQRSVDEFAAAHAMQAPAPPLPPVEFTPVQQAGLLSAIVGGLEAGAAATAAQSSHMMTLEQFATFFAVVSEMSKTANIRPQGTNTMSA